MSARHLTPQEHTIAEQGLLNLALQKKVTILVDGQNVTPSLLSKAEEVNSAYDQLHAGPKPTAKKAPAKSTPRAPRAPRKSTAAAGPPAPKPEK